MTENKQEGFDLGLSDEEKADLENMISDFSADRSDQPASAADIDLQDKVDELHKKFSQMGEIVLKINKRMDAFYEIIQLIHQKSEIMNKRIDMLIESTPSLSKQHKKVIQTKGSKLDFSKGDILVTRGAKIEYSERVP